jgi:hypothetical protein
LYSPFIDGKFEVVGKASDFYWVERRETIKIGRHEEAERQTLDIYNTRMQLANSISPFLIADSLLKEYFVSNDDYFDQLLLIQRDNKTSLILNRYSPVGQTVNEGKTLLNLPFNEDGNSFLLVRSEDRSKLLLLCYEGVPSEGRRLHTFLFDRNWNLLKYTRYKHYLITQPLIQDDFTSYPIEGFSNGPLKLANNGDWLMAAPSRLNSNFQLYHFNGRDTGYVAKEIRLPGTSTWEDVDLAIDNERQEVFAGIVSIFQYQPLKNVQVIHYSMPNHELDFDSSYRFNTLMAYRIINQNLTHESFIMVPGTGFMLLKEYGRPYETDYYDNNQYIAPGGLESVFTDNYIVNSVTPQMVNRDGYTRYDRLSGPRALYNRGDLSLFYFPAHTNDSCWSGIIDKEQVTEFNTPYLSYLVMPVNNKIFLLYNSFYRDNDENQFGNTTVLDYKGNLIVDAGMVYWKIRNTLDFQQSHQIAQDEVAIPYENFKRKGFAIIRF